MSIVPVIYGQWMRSVLYIDLQPPFYDTSDLLEEVEIRKLSQLGNTLRIRLDHFLIVEKHPFALLTSADMRNVVARMH
jgi:hypothetical protein